MTISTADTSIKLDAHSPKKDSIIATGLQVMAADDVQIHIGSGAIPGYVQTIIGGFEVLHATALTLVNSGGLDGGTAGVGRVHMTEGGGSADVLVNGVPGSGDLIIEYGADIVAKRQTHFMDRTFKRLREVWLEGEVGIAAARILAVGNSFTFNGQFPEGQAIEIIITLTDPDGETEDDVFNLTLPPSASGFHLGPVAASVVCARVDSLTHIRCDQVGNVLTVSPSAPANTVDVTIRLV